MLMNARCRFAALLLTVLGLVRGGLADEPDQGAAMSPADVLKSHGLVRAGSSYYLGAESECLEKFDTLRPLYNKLEASYRRLADIGADQAHVVELDAQREAAQDNLRSIQADIDSI